MLGRTLTKSSKQLSTRFFSGLAVKYHNLGQPSEVLKLETETVSNVALGPKDVSVKFLAAPINPSDLNMVEGVYGKKAVLPAIGGNEGVAEVIEAGAESQLKKGDWVIPSRAGYGTWRQRAVGNESDFIQVANDIPKAYAATLTVNPSTSYRLLRDFHTLKPGDFIVQNCANSMVGMGVIQMARELGIKTINIVRSDRPDVQKTMKLLSNLGGDINISDDYFLTPQFNEILAELPPISLALNGVGGKLATDMARVLAPNGTLVTYGNMAKKPLQVPLDLIASRQLKLRGFWMAKWNEDPANAAERRKMLDDIAQLIRTQQLAYFMEQHDLDDFDYALAKATEPFVFRKVVLDLDFPDRLAIHDARTAKDYEMFEYPVG